MKKSVRYVVIAIILLVAAFVYYYITIPAFNIHSVGTWWFVIGAVIVVGVFLSVRKMIREGGGVEYVIKNKTLDFSLNLSTKICLGLLAVLLVTLGIGALLSSYFFIGGFGWTSPFFPNENGKGCITSRCRFVFRPK